MLIGAVVYMTYDLYIYVYCNFRCLVAIYFIL